MIAGLRRAWFRWQLQKTFKKDDQVHAFLPFQQLQRMLLVVQVDTEACVATVQQWQAKWQNNCIITLIGYFPSRKACPFTIPFPHFTAKDLTFGYQPKTTTDWYAPVDAAVFVAPTMSLPLLYMAAHSTATMRVGTHAPTYEPCLDFMVTLPDNTPSLDTIFNTFDRYLKMIRSHEPNQ